MEIIFLPKSKEHLDFFKKVNNPIILKKIRQLLEIIPKNLKDAEEMYYGSKIASVINGKINDFMNILYLKSNSYLIQ